MSDLDDLSDIVDVPTRDRDGDPQRIAAGMKSMEPLRLKALETRQRSLAPGSRLRLSAHTPSLAKLKFMGDK